MLSALSPPSTLSLSLSLFVVDCYRCSGYAFILIPPPSPFEPPERRKEEKRVTSTRRYLVYTSATRFLVSSRGSGVYRYPHQHTSGDTDFPAELLRRSIY